MSCGSRAGRTAALVCTRGGACAGTAGPGRPGAGSCGCDGAAASAMAVSRCAVRCAAGAGGARAGTAGPGRPCAGSCGGDGSAASAMATSGCAAGCSAGWACAGPGRGGGRRSGGASAISESRGALRRGSLSCWAGASAMATLPDPVPRGAGGAALAFGLRQGRRCGRHVAHGNLAHHKPLRRWRWRGSLHGRKSDGRPQRGCPLAHDTCKVLQRQLALFCLHFTSPAHPTGVVQHPHKRPTNHAAIYCCVRAAAMRAVAPSWGHVAHCLHTCVTFPALCSWLVCCLANSALFALWPSCSACVRARCSVLGTPFMAFSFGRRRHQGFAQVRWRPRAVSCNESYKRIDLP